MPVIVSVGFGLVYVSFVERVTGLVLSWTVCVDRNSSAGEHNYWLKNSESFKCRLIWMEFPV
jgi:hypothetical protein